MTFNQEFPRLKNKWAISLGEGGTSTLPLRIPTVIPNKLYSKEVIEEHCLDKQKVKDAIQRCYDGVDEDNFYSCIDDMKKELGLND